MSFFDKILTAVSSICGNTNSVIIKAEATAKQIGGISTQREIGSDQSIEDLFKEMDEAVNNIKIGGLVSMHDVSSE